MQTLRTTHREQLRDSIVESARELFARLGYESFSMRKLAALLGCSHGTLYLYFSSKQQLFDVVVEDSFAQLSSALRHLESGAYANDPLAMLKAAARIYVDFGRQNPRAYEFAFIIRRSGPARPWRPHRTFAFLRNTIQRCIDDRLFTRIEVDAATQAIWAALHGVTSLLIARPTFPWVDADILINRVIDSAIDSLTTPNSQPKNRSTARRRTTSITTTTRKTK